MRRVKKDAPATVRRILQQKQPAAGRLRRLLTLTGLILLTATVTGGALFHQQITAMATNALQQAAQDAKAAFYRKTAEAGFAVREVLVVDRQETPKAELAEKLGIRIGDPILALDLQEIQMNVESLGWVKTADIQRQLPDRIVLHLTERRPAAVRKKGGNSELVDIDGVVIGPHDPDRFTGLKTIRGDGAAAQTGTLLQLLQVAPDLGDKVAAAVRIGDRRWDLHLHNGLVIRLPEQDAERTLRSLAEFIRERELLDREISVIDARLPERITVEAPAVPAPRRTADEQHA